MNEKKVLTPQQQIFINEYLDHFDIKRAADEAGYIDGYYEMIATPVVQTALAEAIKKRIGKGEVSEEKVLIELGKIAFTSMNDFVSWDNNGVKVKDSKTLSEELASCVQEINISPTGRMKIKLYDKKPALELLTRIFGMLKDKVEHTGTIDHLHHKYDDFTDEELDQELQRLVAEAQAVENVNGNKQGAKRNSSRANGSKKSKS